MRTVLLLAAALAVVAATAQAAPAKGLFDVRDPVALVSLLKSMDAKADITRTTGAEVFVSVETPGGNFGAQYVDCDAKGKTCKALIFSTAFAKSATFAQMNSFNKGQVACRGFIGDDGKPNVAYATLVNLRMTAEEVKQHIGVWQGCLGSFADFTKRGD